MAYLPLNSVRNITNAAAKSGGLAFDGVTNAKDLHTIADLASSSISVSCNVSVPSTVPSVASGLWVLSSSSTTYLTARSLYCGIENVSGDGALRLYLSGSNGSYVLRISVASFIANYGGKTVNITCVKDTPGNAGYIYINGVQQTTTSGADGASPPAWSDIVSTTYAFFGQTSVAYLFNSTIFSATLFNRALSASEVVTLANQGVQEADKWGSLTSRYDSTFAVNVDNWADYSGGQTLTGAETINASNDWLKVYRAATGSSRIYRSTGGTYQYGPGFYTLTGTVYAESGSGVTTLYIRQGSALAGTASTTLTVTPGTEQTFSVTSYLPGPSSANPYLIIDAGTLTGLKYIAYKNLKFYKTGSILDADLSAGVGYQVPDRSSNNYHGLISTSGTTWTLPRKTGQAIYTIAASGYLGDGTSRAVIPDGARIDNIQAYSTSGSTFSIGDDSGSPTNVIGSTAISAATLTDLGTPAKRFLTTGTDGRLYVTFSAANSTIFTVNYSVSSTS